MVPIDVQLGSCSGTKVGQNQPNGKFTSRNKGIIKHPRYR